MGTGPGLTGRALRRQSQSYAPMGGYALWTVPLSDANRSYVYEGNAGRLHHPPGVAIMTAWAWPATPAVSTITKSDDRYDWALGKRSVGEFAKNLHVQTETVWATQNLYMMELV